jgi:hypothetical protein
MKGIPKLLKGRRGETPHPIFAGAKNVEKVSEALAIVSEWVAEKTN